jgi:hypothetical protein
MAARSALARMGWLVGWAGTSTRPPSAVASPRRLAGPALAGGALGTLFLLAVLAQGSFSATRPFSVGERFGLASELADRGVPVTAEPGVGYDGQWYLALATDPLLRDGIAAHFDNPRYRAGRPLQAWAGWLLAAGRPGLIPAALLAVGPLAAALGAAATAGVATAFGRSRWWGPVFVLIPGVAVGIAAATSEPLALALAVLGVALLLADRPVAAGVAFAGAALTKESYLAFAVAAAIHLLLEPAPAARRGRPGRLARTGMVLLPGLACLAVWWGYVVGRLPAVPGQPDNAGDALGVPLAGWVSWLGKVVTGHYGPPQVFDAPGPAGGPFVVVSLAVVAAGLLVGLGHRSLPARVALVLGGYALVVGDALTLVFFSTMRVLAPCVLAGLLAVLAEVPARLRTAPDPARAPPAAEDARAT